MATIAAVVYSTNNPEYTKLAVDYLKENSDPALTEIVVVDNGSTPEFPDFGEDLRIRYPVNVGGNAVFHRWIKDEWFGNDEPEFIAFFHCDLMVREKGWDHRVVDAFDADDDLALLGFVGSNEIDEYGGRGGGTMLNYLGDFYEGIGQASPAEAHGRRMAGVEPAAVLDHCSMIFDSAILKVLTPQEGNFAPEHFYDRILSCEVLEKGFHIAVLGASVDHFSGGIGAGNLEADALRKRWLTDEGLGWPKDRSDLAVYVESERRFKGRFGTFFPLKVLPDHTIVRP